MAVGDAKSYHNDFFKWFKIFLKDKGLQFTQCGFKLKDSLGSGHAIDLATGYWENPGYSANKPPRWLYHIEVDQAGVSALPPPNQVSDNIGQANTAQGDKAGLVLRILPLIKTGDSAYEREDAFEVYGLFVFHGAVPQGSSSEPFAFDPATGKMSYRDAGQPYLLGALLGVKPRDKTLSVTIDGTARDITYGEVVDALAASIHAAPQGKAAAPMPVFDLTKEDQFDQLKKAVADAYDQAGPVLPKTAPAAPETGDEEEEGEIVAPAELEVPENTDLVGIDPGVYRQINAALKSGKQHIMLYGPPGTGKTTLARWIASTLTGGKWTLITGSADWSSQDIIGGYQPVGAGSVSFIPGILLRSFDRPLIIDELNRCDIDKVIGPLFTVLSGQQTTLPYRLKIEDPDSRQYVILPEPKPTAAEHEYAPGAAWRIIATINSIDKASLYQMSYALSRRFGWVYVDAPRDTAGFIRDYLHKVDPTWTLPAGGAPCPLAQFWTAINKVRVLGPAPFIDAIKAVQAIETTADFFAAPSPAMRAALLDAIDMVLLPMLDGIVEKDAEELAKAAIDAFTLDSGEQERIKARMASVAV